MNRESITESDLTDEQAANLILTAVKALTKERSYAISPATTRNELAVRLGLTTDACCGERRANKLLSDEQDRTLTISLTEDDLGELMLDIECHSTHQTYRVDAEEAFTCAGRDIGDRRSLLHPSKHTVLVALADAGAGTVKVVAETRH